MGKRYVYGTKSKKWHLVGEEDRDWLYGFTKSKIKKIGKRNAKQKYLSASFI